MVNTSRVEQNANRTIIIPQGTLNSDEVNVVYIPPSLNSTQPLIVKPALGKNKPLRAHSLPIWDDDLSRREGEGESSNISHLIATSGCNTAEMNLNETYEAPAQVGNNTQNLGEAFISDNLDENADYNKMCCDTMDRGPNVVHLSSRSLRISSDGTPQGRSITVDAPEGIDSSLLGNIVQNSTRPGVGDINANFQPPFDNHTCPANATYNPGQQGSPASPTYSSFNPPYFSSQRSDISDSYYDDMYDSSHFETSSGNLDDSMMARVMGGEFNVITPMTPSPTKPACPPTCSSPSPFQRGKNVTYPSAQSARPNPRSNISAPARAASPAQRSTRSSFPTGGTYPASSETFACPASATFAQGSPRAGATFAAPMNLTFAQVPPSTANYSDSYYDDMCDSPCLAESFGEIDDSMMDRDITRPVNATYAQGPQENINYSSFSPPYTSSQQSGDVGDSYYDDMCDSSCLEESSGEIDDSMMGRVFGGEFNVITPMTPSPERPMRTPTPAPLNSFLRGPNATIPQSSARTKMSQRSLPENCPCPEDYPSARNATYAQPAYPASTTFAAPPVNATYAQRSPQNINYSDSYYDDMCDSSCLEESSGEIDDSMMGRVFGGEFNVITPMTPSPERRMRTPTPPPLNSFSRGPNATIPQASARTKMSQRSLPENCPCSEDYPSARNATYAQPAYPANTTFAAPAVNATYAQGSPQSVNYSSFNPPYASSYQGGDVGDSYYDDMCDSSCLEESSGEIDDSMMGRVFGGEFNVITPMTPSPERPMRTQTPPPLNPYMRGVNASIPQPNVRRRMTNRSLPESCPCPEDDATPGDCPCPEDYLGPENAAYTQPALPVNATYAQRAANATCNQGIANTTYSQGAANATYAQEVANATCSQGVPNATYTQGPANATYCQGPTNTTYCQEPANATYSQGVANATYSQGVANATYTQGPANATYSQGVANVAYTQGAANSTYSQGPANATYTQGAANATYSQGPANATYTQGAANATYSQRPANATYSQGVANATYTQGPANATYTQGAANATYSQGPANATYSQGVANVTYTQGAANATYGQGVANATYAEGADNAAYEEDCYCPDLPDSYYDDMYDSSELLNDASGSMDASMMAKVMGGEFNVITPMTPSPTRPTAKPPASLANATYPQPSARGNVLINTSLPTDNCPCRVDLNYPSQVSAAFAACPTNATYAQSPNTTGGSSYGDFNPPHVSSCGSELGSSYYDDMVDSSNCSSEEMDDSMMARVMGGEFNVITPMTPSPEKFPGPNPNTTQGLPTRQANATYVPPSRSSPAQQRSRHANMTYPQPQAQHSLRNKNATWSGNPRSQSGSFRTESPNAPDDCCSGVCYENVGNTTY